MVIPIIYPLASNAQKAAYLSLGFSNRNAAVLGVYYPLAQG